MKYKLVPYLKDYKHLTDREKRLLQKKFESFQKRDESYLLIGFESALMMLGWEFVEDEESGT